MTWLLIESPRRHGHRKKTLTPQIEGDCMKPQRDGILQELLDTVEFLPEEQLREVTDFAEFLNAREGKRKPPPGSADAILRHAGSFQFETGEMDRLLTDIDTSRELDLKWDA